MIFDQLILLGICLGIALVLGGDFWDGMFR